MMLSFCPPVRGDVPRTIATDVAQVLHGMLREAVSGTDDAAPDAVFSGGIQILSLRFLPFSETLWTVEPNTLIESCGEIRLAGPNLAPQSRPLPKTKVPMFSASLPSLLSDKSVARPHTWACAPDV